MKKNWHQIVEKQKISSRKQTEILILPISKSYFMPIKVSFTKKYHSGLSFNYFKSF